MYHQCLQTKGVFLVNCVVREKTIQVGMMVLNAKIEGEVIVISPSTKESFKVKIPGKEPGCSFKEILEKCQHYESISHIS